MVKQDALMESLPSNLHGFLKQNQRSKYPSRVKRLDLHLPAETDFDEQVKESLPAICRLILLGMLVLLYWRGCGKTS